MTVEEETEQGDPAEDILAIDIGRAVLNAHRTASDIVSEAQAKADVLLGSARAASVRDGEYRRREITRLSDMLAELDLVEEELRDRQIEMQSFLDRFLASRQSHPIG